MAENREIHLVKRPETTPTEEHLKIVTAERPTVNDEEILVRNLYVSVDPYMRGRMSDAKSYVEPFGLNEAINGGTVAQVTESKSSKLQIGDIVTGTLPWAEYAVVSELDVRKIDPSLGPVTTSLGVLGMPGLTAYFGLTDIGQPKSGETVVVSAAAGAVGSIVVQIAKIYGAKVVGIAGSVEKTNFLTKTLGADRAINYKTENVREALNQAAPDGVDVYFDNVGGDISDAVYPLLNDFARIAQCGAISSYNDPSDKGPRIHMHMVKSKALLKGFIVGDYSNRFKEGFQYLSKWLQEDKLTYNETIQEGFDQIPNAFFGLFTGDNIGKQLVKVAEPDQ